MVMKMEQRAAAGVMNKPIVLDLETDSTTQVDMKGNEFSDYGNPYNKGSKLCLGGMIKDGEYQTFTTLPELEGRTIIGHNIKYDAKWLAAMGLDTRKVKFVDTMLREAIAGCGEHQFNLSLAKCAARRFNGTKPDLCSKFYDAGWTSSMIPKTILESYLKSDVYNTAKLYVTQEKDPDLQRQMKYHDFAQDVLQVLIRMEHAGIKFNDELYDEVRMQMLQELNQSKAELYDVLEGALKDGWEQALEEHELKGRKTELIDAGDFWKVIYSLKLKDDKKAEFAAFAKRFRPHRNGAQKQLDDIIQKCCEPLEYGLKVKPKAVWMAAAQVQKNQYVGTTGFKADNKMLSSFLQLGGANQKQTKVLEAYLRYSKAKVQYNSSLNSVIKGTRDDGMVHGSFNQTGTVTMRFSSSDPNLQNQTRGGTAPVKKLFRSRHTDGCIVDADYGQLEFRVAGWMSGDEQLIKDVEEGFDIHSHSASMAYGKRWEEADEKGRKALRQAAKGYTFAFQYGAMPKTKIEQAIYDAFYGKYWKLKEWQEKVTAEIAQAQEYVCQMTGKVFKFPYANWDNVGSWATKAKNYPVQYLSAVVTQCAMIEFDRQTQDIEGIDLVIQVHDSLVADSTKENAKKCVDILFNSMYGVSKTFEEYFGIKIPVKLDTDVDVGPTYAETIPSEEYFKQMEMN